MSRGSKAFAVMIVALSGAPAFDAGHAQLGANRSDPLPGGPPSPLPPTLEDPEPNAQVRVQYPVTFRWRAPLSSAEALGAPPPPDHHRLCVVETGGSCQSPSAVVREVKETILSLRLPPALHDKVLDWTVAACWAQKSASGVAFDCAWAAPRKLAVGAATVAIPYPPPRLGSPSPFDGPLRLDPKRPTTVVFRWRPPVSLRESAAGAPDPERYRLCVMEEGSSCDAPGALVYDVGKATLYNVPIPPSFAGKRIAWTAAACGPGYGAVGAQAGVPNADCTWAQPVVVPSETATATTN